MTTITLTVTAFNGAPSDGSLSAHFDEMGGLIGRADSNQLVLPDPDRSISRVHAQVVFRNQRYAIIDRGSNPILVNGQAAGNDREIPLQGGDKVQIGGYELVARLVEGGAGRGPAATAADPFADLLGAPPAGPAASARAGGPAALIDPLAAFGAAPAPARRSTPAPAPAGPGGIPDDWNPFAPDPVAAAGRGGALPAQANALGLDLGAAAPGALIPDLAPSAGSDSLDALFGLKAGASGADPFAQSALDQPMAQPNMAAHADPLKSLASAPLASAGTQADTLSDLQRPFMAAPAVARAGVPWPGDAPAPAPAAAAAAAVVAAPPADPQAGWPAAGAAPFSSTIAFGPSPAAPAAPAAARMAGAVLSWDAAPSEGHTVIQPSPGRGPAPAFAPEPPTVAPAAASTSTSAAAPAAWPAPSAAARSPAPVAAFAASAATSAAASAFAVPAAPAASAATAVIAPPGASADTQALLRALREGLAVPDLKLDALTPDVMRLIGLLLREAAAGTVDLLVARAAFKREMRAEATMIDSRQNNPLKFSPSAEAALQHLLAPPTRGFMAAAPAMRDAYADLRAHQFGMVAGMRSALDGVLERFDPAELEGQLTQRSVLHSLLPGSRKARMWEVFVEHFDRIREEASDDFQTLFGRAFLQAYEQQLDQIDRENSA